MLLMYQTVYAAVPVEESIQPAKSGGTTNYQSPVSPELPTPQAVEVSASGSSLSGLFYQLQLLQQEVQELRGQLEEQQYLLQRLQKASRTSILISISGWLRWRLGSRSRLRKLQTHRPQLRQQGRR